MIISLIVAVAKNGIIGVGGDLPWRLPRDMRFFSETTKGHHVLTGRKNYESIPAKYRPLPGRTNIVVTRDKAYSLDGAHVFQSISEAIDFARKAGEQELFIIGGGEIYRQTLGQADRIYLTVIDAEIEGDTSFPPINNDNWLWQEVLEQPQDDVHNFTFKTYVLSRKK